MMIWLFCFISFVFSQEKLLLIGDSHTVGGFGQSFVSDLSETYQVHRYAISGSSARTWLNETICPAEKKCPYSEHVTPKGLSTSAVPEDFPNFKKLIDQNPRSRVVIALGTNDAMSKCQHGDSETAYKDVAKLLSQIPAGAQCDWIGPPDYVKGPVNDTCGGKYQKFVKGLQKVVEAKGCQFFDSGFLQHPGSGDQLHFSPERAKGWAAKISDKFLTTHSDISKVVER